MTESDFKQLFHAPYTRDAWKKVLNSIFPSSEFFIKDVPIEPKKNAKQIHQFGKITLSDGKSLGLFEVEVTPDTQIARNRVALRENASALIDFDRFHGALAIFYQPGQADYRFSFIAKQTELMDGTLKIEQTHPKRFTYVLGINEPCTTPAKRFLKLLEKRDIKLEDVIEAFEVETLTKEFFKKYKDHYETFCEHLIESKYRKSVFKIPEIKDDDERKKAEKPIRDFVKKLLGRVVFLYFLQKKGWMGVPVDRKDWAGGDPEFMKNLFTRFDNKKHFYSRCLVRLFFETLNTNRPNDLFEITGSRIPYLNGGLFDDDFPESNSIDLPADLFQKLFEFFGEYNFTIDENSPDDHEVGIDPEMLGHIFENLLEDNKDKGAYYTPKAIVHYMCQESLIQYLKTHLAPAGFEVAIERFIRLGNKGDEKDKDNLIRQNAARIEELLDTVKICDPAIGSGAFPMGLLQEILKAKSTLDWTLDRAKTKRNIIQNSIYGVDIDKGAVDIARLRFWLALVVDEETPEPLPNLDYKIMQGNSLLESFEGIDLSKIMNVHKVTVVDSQMNLLTGKEKNPQTRIDFDATRRDDLHKLLNQYFLENDKVKKIDLHRQIDRVVLDHIHASLEGHKDKLTVEVSGLQRIIDNRCAAVKTAAQRENIRKESKEARRWLEKKREMTHVDDKFEKLRSLEETYERPYFLWHLFFKDIFDQGGFHIVIGNPPYIQMQKDGGKLADMLSESEYETFERTGDVYSIFYELGFRVLREKGIHTFITSSQWLKASYGKSLRRFFLSKNPQILIALGPAVFENVTVDTNILITQKESFQNQLRAIAIDQREQINYLLNLKLQPISNVDENSWAILDSSKQRIKQKIHVHGKSLRNWNIKINFGIKTGYNEAFIIDGEKRKHLIKKDSKSKELIKPVMRGREVSSYIVDWKDDYLLFIPWHFPNHHDNTIEGASEKAEIRFRKEYPAVYEHLQGHKKGLQQRNKAETGIRYEWYALQRFAATYLDEFSKEKVIWKRIGSHLRFSYSNAEMLCLDSTCIATGEKIKYLTALLNSSLCKYQLFENAPKTGMGDLIISVQALEPLLVYYPNDKEEKLIVILLDKILAEKKKDPNAITTKWEHEIDVMVYKLYDLKYEEVKIVDPDFKMSKETYEKFEIK